MVPECPSLSFVGVRVCERCPARSGIVVSRRLGSDRVLPCLGELVCVTSLAHCMLSLRTGDIGDRDVAEADGSGEEGEVLGGSSEGDAGEDVVDPVSEQSDEESIHPEDLDEVLLHELDSELKADSQLQQDQHVEEERAVEPERAPAADAPHQGIPALVIRPLHATARTRPGDMAFEVEGHGVLRWYNHKRQIVAQCKRLGHDRCFLTRTVERTECPLRGAQGRPIGFLIAWLLAGEDMTRWAHVHGVKPTFEDRANARSAAAALVGDVPGLQELFDKERAPKASEGEGPEPIGFA